VRHAAAARPARLQAAGTRSRSGSGTAGCSAARSLVAALPVAPLAVAGAVARLRRPRDAWSGVRAGESIARAARWREARWRSGPRGRDTHRLAGRADLRGRLAADVAQLVSHAAERVASAAAVCRVLCAAAAANGGRARALRCLLPGGLTDTGAGAGGAGDAVPDKTSALFPRWLRSERNAASRRLASPSARKPRVRRQLPRRPLLSLCMSLRPMPLPERGGGEADAGTAQPSASAARRRRRAAAKAASREPVVPAAAAASVPPAAESAVSIADALQDSASDDDASEPAIAELSDALQSVHVTPPAAGAHVGAADAAHVAALQAALRAAEANLAEHEARAACKICLDAPCCMLLLPCRHVPLCASPECAAMLGSPPLCPLCRARVADTISSSCDVPALNYDPTNRGLKHADTA